MYVSWTSLRGMKSLFVCLLASVMLKANTDAGFDIHPLMTIRLMSSYLSLLCRLLAPLITATYYALLRNRALIFNGFMAAIDLITIHTNVSGNGANRQQLFGTPQKLNLNTLTQKARTSHQTSFTGDSKTKEDSLLGALFVPTKKIDPLLKTFRVINLKPTQPAIEQPQEPEKSVHCDVLHDPGAGAREMDVIFIHGLKGSLERTWTQGMWQLKARDSKGRILLRKSSSASSINQLQISNIHRQSSEMNLAAAFSEDMEETMVDNNNLCKKLNEVVTLCGEGNARQVSRCWPRDWLPQDCPGVRVIALNYTTDPYLWRPVWINKRCRTSMSERAWEMMQHLSDLGVGEQPIVWVGHSKGGLFVKQMLVHACESSDRKFTVIGEQSRGILFYSVPHRGSPLANLNLPLLRQSIELTEVQKDSAEVIALHGKFRELLESQRLTVEVRSFIETTLTLMSLVYMRIVSVESADAEIGELYGVPIDHRNICKPRSRDCFLYRELISLIDSVTLDRPT